MAVLATSLQEIVCGRPTAWRMGAARAAACVVGWHGLCRRQHGFIACELGCDGWRWNRCSSRQGRQKRGCRAQSSGPCRETSSELYSDPRPDRIPGKHESVPLMSTSVVVCMSSARQPAKAAQGTASAVVIDAHQVFSAHAWRCPIRCKRQSAMGND